MLTKYNEKPFYWDKAKRELAKKDPILKKVMQKAGDTQFLTRNFTPFQTLAKSIIGQQISVAAAASVLKKLKSNIDRFSPKGVYSAKDSTLRNSGLSRQKVEYLRILSTKFVEEPRYFSGFQDMDDETIIEKLTVLKGIGEWTAQMYLIFQLNRSNVLPVKDLGFVNSAVRIYKIKEPKIPNLIKISEKWEGYKTVEVWYLWKIIDPEDVQY